ncbi:MAG: DUF547 domain-containing protein [bacterium]
MSRLEVLNPGEAPATADPAGLSRSLLSEALEARRTGDCEPLGSLAAALRRVDPTGIEGQDARVAFWLNVYNALLLHCLCLRPLHGSLLRHLRMFDRVAYDVGGRPYPLNLIEHGILRRNRRPPFRLRRPLRGGDPRLHAAPPTVDPRVHFALNCGARSCPPVLAYDAELVETQLGAATSAYLDAETEIDSQRRRIALPRLIRLYRADFGDRAERLAFAARHLSEPPSWLEDDRGRVRVRYGRFDWTVARPKSGLPDPRANPET